MCTNSFMVGYVYVTKMSKLSPSFLLNILHHIYILSPNFYQFNGICYKYVCVCIHMYIHGIRKRKRQKLTCPSLLRFFLLCKMSDRKKRCTMSITWKLNRFEDDEVMPTNSRSMCMCVCVSATFENSSGIPGWFLRFIGLLFNSVQKNKSKRIEKNRRECVEWQEKEQNNVCEKHTLHKIYYIQWSAVCSNNILTSMP